MNSVKGTKTKCYLYKVNLFIASIIITIHMLLALESIAASMSFDYAHLLPCHALFILKYQNVIKMYFFFKLFYWEF